MNGEITRADLLENVRASAQEILDYKPEARDIDDLYDDIHEQADSLVNIYYLGAVQEWVVAGMPDAEDYGADAPIHEEPESTTARIYREASVAMYYWYADEMTNALSDLLEARNEVNA